jgi:hypothetical protein
VISEWKDNNKTVLEQINWEVERGSSGSRLHLVETDYKHSYKHKNFVKEGCSFYQHNDDINQETNCLFHYLEWGIIYSSIEQNKVKPLTLITVTEVTSVLNILNVPNSIIF